MPPPAPASTRIPSSTSNESASPWSARATTKRARPGDQHTPPADPVGDGPHDEGREREHPGVDRHEQPQRARAHAQLLADERQDRRDDDGLAGCREDEQPEGEQSRRGAERGSRQRLLQQVSGQDGVARRKVRWVSGSVGQWVSGSVGQWVSGSVGQWVSQGVPASGPR